MSPTEENASELWEQAAGTLKPKGWPVAVVYLVLGLAGLWGWQYYRRTLTPILAYTVPEAQALVYPIYLTMLLMAQQLISFSFGFFRRRLQSPAPPVSQVRQALLGLNYRRFRVLHKMKERGTGLLFDHLVIGPTGVFVILDPPTPQELRDGTYQPKPKAQVDFLRQTLKKLTGSELTVTLLTDAAQASPERLLKLIESGPTVLTDDETKRLAPVLKNLLVSAER